MRVTGMIKISSFIQRDQKKRCCLQIPEGPPHASATELFCGSRGHKGKGQEVTGKWVSNEHIYKQVPSIGSSPTQFHKDRENICCVHGWITSIMVVKRG